MKAAGSGKPKEKMDTEMGSNLISDSCGQTPAKSMDRKSQTTRFYGVSFLRGKIRDNDIEAFYDKSKGYEFDTNDAVLCCLLVVSLIAIISGVSFALAGHFTPKKKLIDVTASNGTAIKSNVEVVLHYNRMLETFVLCGIALLAVGIVIFMLIIISPLCFAYEVTINKKKGYDLASNSDGDEMMLFDKLRDDNQVANGNRHELPATGHFATMHQQLRPINEPSKH